MAEGDQRPSGVPVATTGAPQPHFSRAEQFREIYCNFATSRLSPYDISLTFYQTKQMVGLGQITNEEQITVVMSPLQMKMLAELCTSLVNTYETAFSPITIPPGVRNPNFDAMTDAAKRLIAGIGATAISSTEQKPRGALSRGASKPKAKKL